MSWRSCSERHNCFVRPLRADQLPREREHEVQEHPINEMGEPRCALESAAAGVPDCAAGPAGVTMTGASSDSQTPRSKHTRACTRCTPGAIGDDAECGRLLVKSDRRTGNAGGGEQRTPHGVGTAWHVDLTGKGGALPASLGRPLTRNVRAPHSHQ